ncbi:hypothetical protein BOTBODRAFT_178812 [Botryobasidium botryosum FD-172 SS1]|uniref:Uncharacterized protein n=1 Tax=Botryobasidium botryosum (strain FD-172 SS1) TaxID=930990 RepID=A0A067MD07_BOTB1|nr:hypothetical protein BOTBODRAFT_178812 [Botryobasidium botryosum FD-172 SS1]
MAEQEDVYAMPLWSHRSVPKFDENEPAQLSRFFKTLETRKDGESVEECGGAERGDYKAFKQAIFDLYPGAEEEKEITVKDVEKVVEARKGREMMSRGDLMQYHRAFLSASNPLVTAEQLSVREQNRLYFSGFSGDLFTQVHMRLGLLFPNHWLRDPYPIKDVRDAAMFFLDGTPTELVNPVPLPAHALPSSGVRANDSALFTSRRSPQTSDLEDRPHDPLQLERPPYTSHYVRDCPRAAEYVRDGKCIRDAGGRIVLPNTNMVPRGVGGQTMLERIDAWHVVNPGQMTPTSAVTRDPPPHMRAGVNLEEVEEEDRVAVLMKALETELRLRDEKKKVRFVGGSGGSGGRTAGVPTVAVFPKVTPEPVTPVIQPSSRQYHYLAPIDDPEASERVC